MDSLINQAPRFIIDLMILVFSITIHEVAHGWVALKEGDPTAQQANRLTLNPIHHIDPFMSIIMPLVFYMSAGFVFGGAKPVPVNPYNFRDLRKSDLKVSAAGPGSNLVLAIIGALIIRIIFFTLPLSFFSTPLWEAMKHFLTAFVSINLVLLFFNLLPIPPLDGSKILINLLPPKYEQGFRQFETYGMMILIVLLFTGVLGYTLFPMINFFFRLLIGI
ncbi:site-2 protease family protein [candidate division CSSED10-310 bacterium]|uniref:Site-2 protease family protein n=1 Tax=candidate division CSSED10-310 bacterium TaxID=2855610 RepID=A0ABV6YXH9_UNCC1